VANDADEHCTVYVDAWQLKQPIFICATVFCVMCCTAVPWHTSSQPPLSTPCSRCVSATRATTKYPPASCRVQRTGSAWVSCPPPTSVFPWLWPCFASTAASCTFTATAQTRSKASGDSLLVNSLVLLSPPPRAASGRSSRCLSSQPRQLPRHRQANRRGA